MKHFVPPVAGLMGWAIAQLAFANSAPDCVLLYSVLAALGAFISTGLVVWVLPRIPPLTSEQIAYLQWEASWTPPRPTVYHGPFVDPVWAENQREMARLLWLDGSPTPPTDWYGARG